MPSSFVRIVPVRRLVLLVFFFAAAMNVSSGWCGRRTVMLNYMKRISGVLDEDRHRVRGNLRVSLSSMSFYDMEVNLARHFRRAQTGRTKRVTNGGATMRRVKQASRRKRKTKAAVVTAAGVGLSLFGSASGSTMPVADIPQSSNTSPNQRFILGEEEMQDVSLATFHLFDRENVGSAIQLARGGCGGCGHGCGGGGGCGHGCGGCGHGGFGGCGHGGFVGCRGCGGCRGCRGCGGCGFIGFGFGCG